MRIVLILILILIPLNAHGSELRSAKNFTLRNFDNTTISLSDFKGKVVVINFFATHCPPCRAEMPDFVRLHEKYKDKGFSVIAISVDVEFDKIIPSFVKAMKITFPVLKANRQVISDYDNVFALPVTFVLNKEHKIIKKINGPITFDSLEPIVKKELNL